MDTNNFIAKYKYAILKALMNMPSNNVKVSFDGFKVFDGTRRPFGSTKEYDSNEVLLVNILKTIVLENNADSIQKLVKIISSVRTRALKEYVLTYPYIFDWKSVSKNSYIEWEPDDIHKFSEFLDFKELSFNPSVRFNIKLIEAFGEYWDWVGLSGNPAAFRGCGDYLLNHPAAIYKPELNPNRKSPGATLFSELIKVNQIYSGLPLDEQSFLPSISTNSSITWTEERVKHHFDKIDFWAASLISEIDSRAFYLLKDKLNENREFKEIYTKNSDWVNGYVEYRNGWENLLQNGKIICDKDILDSLSDFYVIKIGYDGDARSGHTKKEVMVSVSSLLIPKTINLGTFDAVIKQVDIIPHEILNEHHVDQALFEKIIFPNLLENPSLVERLFWSL